MHVILNPTYLDRCASKRIKGLHEVRVEFAAYSLVKPWGPVLGAKDQMDSNVCQGLRHMPIIAPTVSVS